MTFAGISMQLEAIQLEMNIEVINFLLEHGANPKQKCPSNNKDSFEMAKSHCAKD